MLVVLFTAIVLRLFVFEVYYIPSGSMTPTLVPGDVVLVSKLHYGSRLIWQEKVKRVPGFQSVEKGDVIVFNFPLGDSLYSQKPEINFYNNVNYKGIQKALADTLHYGKLINVPLQYRTPYIKRCVALPGEDFLIHKGEIYNPAHKEYDSLLEHRLSRNRVKQISAETPEKFRMLFPYTHQWHQNYMGPFKAPALDRAFWLDEDNLAQYKRIIQREQLEHPAFGLPYQYQFQQNYYFMMGDNIHNSMDSRYWGFLPEDHIIGKASLVLLSWDSEAEGFWQCIRWNRIFKPIK